MSTPSMTSPGRSAATDEVAAELCRPGRDAALLADDARLDLHPLRDPTLVTLAGDWHGEADFASALIERAPAGPTGTRVVVQLGDFSVWPGRAGAAFLDAVADSLLRADASLLFIDGNHEDHPQLLGYPVRADGLRVVSALLLARFRMRMGRGCLLWRHGCSITTVGPGSASRSGVAA